MTSLYSIWLTEHSRRWNKIENNPQENSSIWSIVHLNRWNKIENNPREDSSIWLMEHSIRWNKTENNPQENKLIWSIEHSNRWNKIEKKTSSFLYPQTAIPKFLTITELPGFKNWLKRCDQISILWNYSYSNRQPPRRKAHYFLPKYFKA